jgi:hypothetical protein
LTRCLSGWLTRNGIHHHKDCNRHPESGGLPDADRRVRRAVNKVVLSTYRPDRYDENDGLMGLVREQGCLPGCAHRQATGTRLQHSSSARQGQGGPAIKDHGCEGRGIEDRLRSGSRKWCCWKLKSCRRPRVHRTDLWLGLRRPARKQSATQRAGHLKEQAAGPFSLIRIHNCTSIAYTEGNARSPELVP